MMWTKKWLEKTIFWKGSKHVNLLSYIIYFKIKGLLF